MGIGVSMSWTTIAKLVRKIVDGVTLRYVMYSFAAGAAISLLIAELCAIDSCRPSAQRRLLAVPSRSRFAYYHDWIVKIDAKALFGKSRVACYASLDENREWSWIAEGVKGRRTQQEDAIVARIVISVLSRDIPRDQRVDLYAFGWPAKCVYYVMNYDYRAGRQSERAHGVIVLTTSQSGLFRNNEIRLPFLVDWIGLAACVGFWSLVSTAMFLAVRAFWRVVRAKPAMHLVCAGCGYSRFGIPESSRCPECGRVPVEHGVDVVMLGSEPDA